MYRQQKFEEQLEENIDYLNQLKNEIGANPEKGWENTKKSDPKEISTYFLNEAYPSKFFYFLDYNEHLITLEKGNIFTGTFITHAYEGSLRESYFITDLVSMAAYYEWRCDHINDSGGTCCKIFLDYTGKYEDKNQRFDWEEFKRSDEYRAFLNEFYYYLENKEDKTLEKAYQQVKDLEKSVVRNPYKKALQEFYVYLAETGYRNYKMHKNQNDLTAVADAEAVYCAWKFSQNLDTAKMFFTLTGYQSGFIYMHNSIVDFIGVLFLSTFVVVIIRSVIRKISEST